MGVCQTDTPLDPALRIVSGEFRRHLACFGTLGSAFRLTSGVGSLRPLLIEENAVHDSSPLLFGGLPRRIIPLVSWQAMCRPALLSPDDGWGDLPRNGRFKETVE